LYKIIISAGTIQQQIITNTKVKSFIIIAFIVSKMVCHHKDAYEM